MKHRHPLPAVSPELALIFPDAQNMATCIKAPERCVCDETFCPRHEPEAYASHMARHATDTLASA